MQSFAIGEIATCLLVFMSSKAASLDDLLYLMDRLRDPISGCPWDMKQSFESIAPCTLEEVYEVIDAIENKNFYHLKEELGDLLFQVVFYSKIADEKSLFNFDDIVSSVTQKLISRHPHVFPKGTLKSKNFGPKSNEDDLYRKKRWESLKSIERKKKGKNSTLSDIPSVLPALMRAQKIQKRAASVGFDWKSLDEVFAKINEEIKELHEAIDIDNKKCIEEELGDTMFTIVNLCKHLNVDAETALRGASNKFERRFKHIETKIHDAGEVMTDFTPERLENLWSEAKDKISSE